MKWRAQVKTSLCQTLTPPNADRVVDLSEDLRLFASEPHTCLDVSGLERLKEKTAKLKLHIHCCLGHQGQKRGSASIEEREGCTILTVRV